ncbi:hypothetical protein OF377_02850, partial [Ureaplasma sp. ES3154-GEN]|uniref:Vmc-like lipoprotein signal peptide domain-containing protein n=1 Tax=Ureaplasma sp. ES3154-GEN TaxID=2984844 RepID=UPI0021E71ACC
MKKFNKKFLITSFGLLSAAALIASVATACKKAADPLLKENLSKFDKFVVSTRSKYSSTEFKDKVEEALEKAVKKVNLYRDGTTKEEANKVMSVLNALEKEISTLTESKKIDWNNYNAKVTLTYKNQSNVMFSEVPANPEKEMFIFNTNDANLSLVFKKAMKKTDGITVTYTLSMNSETSPEFSKEIKATSFKKQETINPANPDSGKESETENNDETDTENGDEPGTQEANTEQTDPAKPKPDADAKNAKWTKLNEGTKIVYKASNQKRISDISNNDAYDLKNASYFDFSNPNEGVSMSIQAVYKEGNNLFVEYYLVKNGEQSSLTFTKQTPDGANPGASENTAAAPKEDANPGASENTAAAPKEDANPGASENTAA